MCLSALPFLVLKFPRHHLVYIGQKPATMVTVLGAVLQKQKLEGRNKILFTSRTIQPNIE